MQQYILDHEAYIRGLLESSENQDWASVRDYHKTQIMFMQHERLIHMMVTLSFGFFLAISLFMALLFNLAVLFLLVFVLGVIEVFYMLHLYRLETGVQRWYGLYREISSRVK